MSTADQIVVDRIKDIVRAEEFISKREATLLVDALEEQVKVNDILVNVCEHMARDHIAFGVVGSDEKVHPDWCVQCVFDKLREAIAERTQWAHEHSHTDSKDGSTADWRDCPMPTCFEARALVATKLPFSEADDAPTD